MSEATPAATATTPPPSKRPVAKKSPPTTAKKAPVKTPKKAAKKRPARQLAYAAVDDSGKVGTFQGPYDDMASLTSDVSLNGHDKNTVAIYREFKRGRLQTKHKIA